MFSWKRKESTGNRSFIQTSYQGYLSVSPTDYDFLTDTFVVKEGSNWYAAHPDVVAYYLDPRNFLNEEGIFMFEKQDFSQALESQYPTLIKSIFGSGKLGADELFYFKSRGISEHQAEKIMSVAKIQSVASLIPNQNIQEKINEVLTSSEVLKQTILNSKEENNEFEDINYPVLRTFQQKIGYDREGLIDSQDADRLFSSYDRERFLIRYCSQQFLFSLVDNDEFNFTQTVLHYIEDDELLVAAFKKLKDPYLKSQAVRQMKDINLKIKYMKKLKLMLIYI